MHCSTVWRKLQAKGIELSIQGIPITHNNTLQTRFFLHFTSQFFNPITLESKRTTLHSFIIYITIIIRHTVVYNPPIQLWWWTHIRINTLQSQKTQKQKFRLIKEATTLR